MKSRSKHLSYFFFFLSCSFFRNANTHAYSLVFIPFWLFPQTTFWLYCWHRWFVSCTRCSTRSLYILYNFDTFSLQFLWHEFGVCMLAFYICALLSILVVRFIFQPFSPSFMDSFLFLANVLFIFTCLWNFLHHTFRFGIAFTSQLWNYRNSLSFISLHNWQSNLFYSSNPFFK